MLRTIINGAPYELDIARDTPLLWVLRDTLGLKGTKFGCGVGICGICTVLVDGEPLRSCVVPAGEVADRDITTIEGLAQRGHPVLSAWIREQVPQCGYCQPGQILAAVALLREHPDPDDAEIDAAMAGVLCRCCTYQRIRRAIRTAAELSPAAVQPLAVTPAPVEPGVALDDWIRIARDGTVTVVVNHSEMGQGVTTALAMLVAEELEVDLAQVRTEFAPADVRYRNPMFNEQTTGGSTSVRGEWERLSVAGARARARLIRAAAQLWGVKPEACAAEHGTVVHRPTGRRLGYGELAGAAAAIKAPRRVALKRPDQCGLLGHELPRVDIPEMAAGRTVYGMDVSLPEMRVATVLRCPVVGGKVATFDAQGAMAVPGVEGVFPITRGVAVMATDTWSALKGREALTVDWDLGPHAALDTAALVAELNKALEHSGDVRQRAGHAERALGQAARVVEADYATAHLAHATLEPMNCTARLTGDGCEVWVGTQSQEGARNTASRVSGLRPAQVEVHSQYLGGGFGRRLESDMVEEAVEIAKAAGCAVQVVWTRADDMQHDHYRPAYVARLRAALDADGWPVAWWQRGASQAVAAMGCAQLPYAIPNVRVEFVEVGAPVPAGAWRSVGAGQDAFVVESFIDELAHAAGRDPFGYRHALLRDAPRHRAVLELVATKAGWGTTPPAGRHRGIAVYRSFGSYVAEVAEVSVADSAIRIHRVVCAVDCGRRVNPDTVRAQIEGGVAFGLSATLKEAITIAQGRVEQSTFEDYPILTLAEMPEVEVHIVESDEAPGGAGEPGVPPIAPAVANAVAAATGLRLRSLPLRFEG
jgi:isoquinoline 1-oxidoreductase beta subunit